MAVDQKGKTLPKGIVQRPDGRYMGRFSYAGERYTLYDDRSPSQLKKKMEDMRYELEHGLVGSCDKITLNQWFDAYLKTYKVPILKESTINHYEIYYRLYIQKPLGKKYIGDIKGVHIQKLYNDMAEKNMKNNTIKKVANILHGALERAVIDETIMKNPCMATVIPKTDKKERRVLTANEQTQFLNFVKTSVKWGRYYPLFVTAFGTGMRIGEILALNWSDLNFNKKEIRVNKTLQYIPRNEKGKSHFVLQTPKTKKSLRTIPMLDNVGAALKRLKEEQRKDIIMLERVWEKNSDPLLNNLVFTTETGKPMDRNSVNRTIYSIVQDMNVRAEKDAEREKRKFEKMETFSAHSMRHSFATRCFEAGVPAKVVQSFLGHSTFATTMDIYTHVTEENQKEEIEKIANAI